MPESSTAHSPRGDAPSELTLAVARGDGPAPLLLDMWKRTRTNWSFASDRLAAVFRQHKELGSVERRFLAEALYGMIRHFLRIDEALAVGGLRAVSSAPDSERLLAFLVLEAGLPPALARRRNNRVDWDRVAAIDDQLGRIKTPWRRIAILHSMGEFFARRLCADHGDAAEPLAAALNRRAPMTVRVNTLRGTRDELIAALAAEGIASSANALSPTALVVDTRTNLFSLDAFRAGRFEAQDEGSQLIAELVAPAPRSLVVDYCAGAGGKTLALSAAMNNRGRVVASDVDKRKLAELRRRARRAGVDNVQSVELSPDPEAALPKPLSRVQGKVLRVLVDAPCTGSGSIRRNPEARYRIDAAELERMVAAQRAIATRALELVAPGGRLIYATCSVFRAENQAVVQALIAAHPDFEVMPVKSLWGRDRAASVTDADGQCLEILPHRHGTDGFFAAVLRRRPAG